MCAPPQCWAVPHECGDGCEEGCLMHRHSTDGVHCTTRARHGRVGDSGCTTVQARANGQLGHARGAEAVHARSFYVRTPTEASGYRSARWTPLREQQLASLEGAGRGSSRTDSTLSSANGEGMRAALSYAWRAWREQRVRPCEHARPISGVSRSTDVRYTVRCRHASSPSRAPTSSVVHRSASKPLGILHIRVAPCKCMPTLR